MEYQKNHDVLSDEEFKDKLIVTLGGKGCRYKDEVYSVQEVLLKMLVGQVTHFLQD